MKKHREKKSVNTGIDVQRVDMTYEHNYDDEHCQLCGGYLWAIHDSDGLIIYYKCGDCGAKK